MEPAEYANIARLEETHWWYRGMATISLSLLTSHFSSGGSSPHLKSPPHSPHSLGGSSLRSKSPLYSLNRSPLRILDAGCGPGGMLTRLARFGRPIGVDFHPLALAYAQGRAPLARASVERLPFATNSFDLITSFDVLYHRAVGDDLRALHEFNRVLQSPDPAAGQPGGCLLLRVPASEALRGAHDLVVHTQRRYTAAELGAKLRAAGFEVRRLTYANTLLLPLIALRRKLQSGSAETASDVELPSPSVNQLLEFILKIENLWLSKFNLPFGVSLFALAAKAEQI